MTQIQNHPSVLIKPTVDHEVFTAGALEERVRRTSAFRAPAGETEWGLCQQTSLVLYLLYTQPEISFSYCIIA